MLKLNKKNIETMKRDEQDLLQFNLFKALLSDVKNTKYYKNIILRNNIDIKNINNLHDMEKFPFLDRNDLLDNNIFDFVACQKKDVESVSATGGTSGKSKLILVDKNCNKVYQTMIKRLCDEYGISSGSTVALLAPMGLGLYGWAWIHGLSNANISCIPFGLGSDYGYVGEIMQRLDADQVVSSPAVVVSLTNSLLENNISPKKFKIQNIVLAGSPLTPKIKNYLHKTWGAKIWNFFGATEGGPMAGECEFGDGFHMFIDLFIAEVVDVNTGERVKEGDVGELIITTLANKATPLVRYRTHDLVKVSYKKCKCGRLTPRMWHMGRNEDTIYLEGAHKLHGYIVESALSKIRGLSTDFQLRLTKDKQTDLLNFTIESLVDVKKINTEDVIKNIECVSNAFKQGIKEGRFKVSVIIVPAGTLEKTPRGKIKNHIIDMR